MSHLIQSIAVREGLDQLIMNFLTTSIEEERLEKLFTYFKCSEEYTLFDCESDILHDLQTLHNFVIMRWNEKEETRLDASQIRSSMVSTDAYGVS